MRRRNWVDRLFDKTKEQNKRESEAWNKAYNREMDKASDISKLSAWERLKYEDD